MRVSLRLFAFTVAGIAMLQHVQAESPEFVTSVEGISEYRLDNGLKVLLFPDPSKPRVTVNLTIFVGSRHEGYGEAGMAHLLEHMLFKGTPAHPDVPKVLKEHGADFNGTTWLDRTNYYETLPASSENLEFAITLEADRMVNSYVKKEDLDSEMSVVRNEFERGENSPSRILNQRLFSAAYEWHNYGKSTIGNRADIERVPIESLQRFYKRYYQPDNAMVIVAGQFEPEQALQLIKDHFGIIPKPDRVLDNTYTQEPSQDGERLVRLRRVGEAALCGAVYHIPAGAHPDYVPLDIVEHVMTNSPSGRLYQKLVMSRRAASVSGGAYALHDPGVLLFNADVAPGNDPEDLLSDMLAIVEGVADDPITAEEVERARRYWVKTWELSLTDSMRMARQLSDWAAQGDWRLMFLYRDRLEACTVEEVNAVAVKYLVQNNRTAGLFIPTAKPERASVPETPDLAKMIGDYQGREAVALGEAFDVSPENIESRTTRSTLSTGIKVALLPKQTRGQSVQLKLSLHYGAADSLQGFNAAAESLPSLMQRGTKQLSRQQIQDELDRLKSRLSPSGSVGDATFTLETRRESLPEVLGLLRQILREPTLPKEELGIVQNAKVTRLEQESSDPTSLARVAVSRYLSPYPSDDVRYVPTTEEEIERWKAVSRADVARLYSEFLGGQHGELTVVGDFDPAEITPLLESLVAGWTTSTPYERIARTGEVNIPAKRDEILTPDKENATYLAGTVFPIGDDNPDYPALLMGNYSLGSSGLSSRLGDRVRQAEGLSYSVGSFVNASSLDERMTMIVYAIANPTNMPKAEVAIREEIEKLLAEGVTQEELDAARDGYLKNQIVERSDDSELASTLNKALQAERTMLYYADLESRLRALTIEDVQAALKKNLTLDRYAIVVAGDFKPAEQAAAAGQ
ncbi:MAG: insulinase family protein [Planctomycetaceae bacterium]|nr:insulinase family protein [Planctomycetaceae bacterium]